MPNLDPWVNQNEDIITKTINNFENHLLYTRAECQTMIHPNSHPAYNERHQKIYRTDRLDFREIYSSSE